MGDADILKITLLGEPVGCGGFAKLLPTPNNASVFFGGSMVVQREGCPRVNGPEGSGDVPGYSVELPSGGSGNASLEFFCK